MEKIFYTVGEAASILGVPDTTVRYWSDSFPRFVTPKRNAKGNRLFRKDDIEMLKRIRYLVKDKGMTLDGAAAQLASDRSSVDKTVKAVDILEEIKARLIEVRKSL